MSRTDSRIFSASAVLFESLCMRDLTVYARSMPGSTLDPAGKAVGAMAVEASDTKAA